MMIQKYILLCGGSLIILLFCMNFISSAKLVIYPTSDEVVNLIPDSGSDNYAMVDEMVYDDTVTYLYTTSASYVSDLYGLSNRPTTGDAGTINSVTVHARIGVWAIIAGAGMNGLFQVKSGTTTDTGAAHIVSTAGTGFKWQNFSDTWNTNPDTSNAWTWDEIDSLQAGTQLKLNTGTAFAVSTQVWIVVDYNLPTGETLRPDGDDNVNLVPAPNEGEDNYEDVDEAVLDEDDYVGLAADDSYTQDTYTIANSAVGNGAINSVTVVSYIDGGVFTWTTWGYAKLLVDMGGTEYLGQEQRIRAKSYYSQTWDENPDTSSTWTWTDINNLKAGVSLKDAGTTYWWARCYQFYVIVNYTVAGDTCSPTSPLTYNYVFECSDACTQSTNLDADGYNITLSGAGSFTMTANISNVSIGTVLGGCKVTCIGGCVT